ncbi:MAG: hypothetical protein L6R36_004267 [Xanthoria steineri]|nr:MAG: hypothetical protein L6R36_004267 [Xanthoria steineri]
MSFRLNFDLSLSFPPPPSRSQRPLAGSEQPPNARQEIKKGFRGWLQTARSHPSYSLRLLYFLSAIAGIILDNLVIGNVWHSYRMVDIHRMALAPLIIGLLWQLISIYDKRLFHGRQIPNWATATVESLGFLGFLTLFVGHRIALIDGPRYLALGEMLLLAYDSAVWIILWYFLFPIPSLIDVLVHGILAAKCHAQGLRNLRSRRAGCSECEHGHGKGKGHAADDEEALLGGEEPERQEGEPGPSQQVAPAQYRDDVQGVESS